MQIVLCAGAPDTPEIEAEVVGLVDGLKQDRDGVVWIREMLPRPDVVAALSRAASSGWLSSRSIHTTPLRCCCSSRTPASTSARISGVSGAPAHRTTCTSGGSLAAARSR